MLLFSRASKNTARPGIEPLEARRLLAFAVGSVATIQAEDFDNGGQGVSFYDVDLQNQGGQYRNTPVDIVAVSDSGGGYAVAYTRPGEWLHYTLNVQQAGNYSIDVRVASGSNGGTFHLDFNGVNKTGAMNLANTGGWNKWKTISKTNVSLGAGTQVMRLFFDASNTAGQNIGDVNWIRLTRVVDEPPPPPQSGSTPFNGVIPIPGRIEAENFDNGGQGVSFWDFDSANQGGKYRSTPVDIVSTSDAGGGFAVGYTRAGEWLQYSVNIIESGTYNLEFRVASGSNGGKFHVEFNGVDKTGPISLNNTGGWSKWTTITKTNVSLSAGAQFMRLVFDSANTAGQNIGDINWIGVTKVSQQPPPPPPPGSTPYAGVIQLPGLIQAENFDNGGQGVSFWDVDSANQGGQYRNTPVDIVSTSDGGGGFAVGYTRAGEWLQYSVNITESGLYNLEFRVASGSNGGKFHVEFSGVDKTGPISLNNTGGWSKWTTITKTNVSLTAGTYFMRLVFDSSNTSGQNIGDVNWIRVVRVNQPAPGTWSTGATMPVRLGEVANGIIGDKLYVVGDGSNRTLAYNLTTGTWQDNLAVRPHVAKDHIAQVYNGRLYLFGGVFYSGGQQILNKVQIYNPATNSWSLGADMPFPALASQVAMINNLIYVAGGVTSGNVSTTKVARYNPATNTWTMMADMPVARNSGATGTNGSLMYIFGGRGPGSGDGDSPGNGFADVLVYNPATNSWTASFMPGSNLAPLPQARGGIVSAPFVNGEFYVIGGETVTGAGATPDKVYNRVDIYNPVTNTWRLGNSMPTARHGITPIAHAGRIYVAGGGIVSGKSESNILEILYLA